MAGKPTDDDFMRMARESVMRMADSRGDSMPGSKPGGASGAVNDSRSQALRSQLEASGGQSMGAGGKAGAEFKAGDRFANRYTIRALIAQGGMGAVYRATDENTGEIVALKTIRPDFVNSPEAVERFLSEGKVTRRLAHPGIARVFDIDKAEGRWFIAMEFVRGQTLREWMRHKDAKGARISVKDALWAARKILDVLAYLHTQGIIHRDLKPENIIVGKADDGSGNFLKIIDFGLARSLAGNGPQLTATGAAMGTFAYMSPEQRAGKPLDQRTDIYSAAVIIYEMLTGVAYDGNWEGVAAKRDDLPVGVVEVLRRALSKFRENRHPDANDLLAALQAVPASSWNETKAGPGTQPFERVRYAKEAQPSDLPSNSETSESEELRPSRQTQVSSAAWSGEREKVLSPAARTVILFLVTLTIAPPFLVIFVAARLRNTAPTWGQNLTALVVCSGVWTIVAGIVWIWFLKRLGWNRRDPQTLGHAAISHDVTAARAPAQKASVAPVQRRGGYQRISAKGWALLLMLTAGTLAYPVAILTFGDSEAAKQRKQAYANLESKGEDLDRAIENEIDALNRYAGKLEGYGLPADPDTNLSALRQARAAIPTTIRGAKTASDAEIGEFCRSMELHSSFRGIRYRPVENIDFSELFKGTDLGREYEAEKEVRRELEKFRKPYDDAVKDTNDAMKAFAGALREYAESR